MDTELLILMIVGIFSYAIIFLFALSYLHRSKHKMSIPNELYRISILGRVLILSKHQLKQIGVIFLLYICSDMILPSLFPILIVLLILWMEKIIDFDKIEINKISETSKNLENRLSKMQSEVADIRQYIQGLGQHLISKQVEIDQKEKLRKQIEYEMEKKSKEAAHWKSLTIEQRNLVLDSATEALSKESKGNFGFGLIFGFIINLLATLTWTLLGNPGKEQILNHLKKLFSIFK